VYEGRVTVSTDDPGNARAESRSAFTIEWPQATVASEARQVIRSDSEAYHLTVELDVTEDGEPRWSRRWERRIPRVLQ